jgi:hypothetical protein
MSTTILSSAAAGPANDDTTAVATNNLRMDIPGVCAATGGPPDASPGKVYKRQRAVLDLGQLHVQSLAD